MEPQVNILKNATDSIILGLEDYESTDSRRIISCARNLYAGVLLLFKYKLVELSPANSDEVLIKRDVLPKIEDGCLSWIGKGEKTVDLQGIQTRLKALDIDVDWKRVEKIQRYRNNIEHYYSTESKESLQTLIQNVFVVIQEFVSNHLEDDLKDRLGEYAYNVLIKVQEVYDREKKLCLATFDEVDWESPILEEALSAASCPDCGSTLIIIDEPCSSRYDNEFRCKSCDEAYLYPVFAKQALSEFFYESDYFAMKDYSGSPAVVQCPCCYEEGYIYSEEACVLCGGSVSHVCKSCSNEIPPEELNEDEICSWCLQVRFKDD